MSILKNKILLMLLLLACSVCSLLLAQVKMSAASLERAGVVQKVELPVSLPSEPDGGMYTLVFELRKPIWGPSRFSVIPDDRVIEMYLNGQKVDLSGISSDSLQDFVRGFQVDLSPSIKSGVNEVKIQFSDRGGEGLFGIKVTPSIISIGTALAAILFLAAMFFLLLEIKIKFKLSVPYVAVYLAIVVGFLLRVVLIFVYNPVDHIWSDPERHWQQGIDLLRIDLMSATDPILFQVYIAILAKLTLKIPSLVGFYTAILSVVTPWIWYRFVRELGLAKLSALVVFAVLAFLPSWVSIYSYFMQETLLLPLLGAGLWATWRARRKATIASFIAMVIFWCLAGLTRGIAIPLAAVCCIWLWLEQDEKLKKSLYSLLVLILILGPLSYRSIVTVNHLAPHGMGYLAAIYGISGKREIIIHTERQGARWTHGFGSPSTGAEPFSPISDWKTQRTGAETVTIDLDEGRRDWKLALEKARSNFENHFWIYKENIIFLFFGPSWPDSNMERVVDIVNYHMRWIWLPLFLFALGLMWVKRSRIDRLYLVLILTWFVVQALMPIAVNEGRYRKPFEGLIIVQLALLLRPRLKNQLT